MKAMLTTMLVAAAASPVPLDYPPEMDSSVHINQCSGTVFARYDDHSLAVSCAHCFKSLDVGDHSKVGSPESAPNLYRCTLIAIDRDRDLSLWRCPADVARPTVASRDIREGGQWTATGYSGGRGPVWKRLGVPTGPRKTGDRSSLGFKILDGRIEGGDSGGGVFCDGRLVTVLWGRTRDSSGLEAVPPSQFQEFLEANKKFCRDGGCWFRPEPKMDEPNEAPKPSPSPSVQDARVDGLIKRIETLEQAVSDLRRELAGRPDGPAVASIASQVARYHDSQIKFPQYRVRLDGPEPLEYNVENHTIVIPPVVTEIHKAGEVARREKRLGQTTGLLFSVKGDK